MLLKFCQYVMKHCVYSQSNHVLWTTQCASIKKTDQWMLYRDIAPLYFKNHMEYIKTLGGKYTEFLTLNLTVLVTMKL